MVERFRCLVTLPPDPATRSAVAELLPGVESAFLADVPRGPWLAVEAMLVGNLNRELPTLRPSDVPALQFVQTLYTGVDAFPFDHLPPKARVAGNIGAYAPFVAEHAVALCLALARRLPEGHRQLASGSLRPTPMLTFLGGKTALVVGYGEIAEEIARRLKGLGMRVVGVNRSGELRPGVDRMLPIGRLLEGLPGAAVVIDCLPLTRETRGLFGSEAMEAIAPDGIFVNVGRAETVEPAALKARLDRGGGFRAGLDVWWNEDFSGGTVPLPFDVGAYPTLIASPHNAGFVPEARRFVLERALSNLARHFRGETPLHLEDRSRYEKGP